MLCDVPHMDKMTTDISYSFWQTAQDIFHVSIPVWRSMIRNMEQVRRELNGFGALGAKLIPALRLKRLWRTADDKWTDLSEIILECGSQSRAQSIWEAYRINVLIVKFSSNYVHSFSFNSQTIY